MPTIAVQRIQPAVSHTSLGKEKTFIVLQLAIIRCTV